MWISQKKYRELLKRIGALEEATYCPSGYSDTKIGRLLHMVIDHLGLRLERTLQNDRLSKKGGPERGS